MSLTSAWLSRRLGYGFAYDEELPSVENWIARAKEEVATVSKFDPWRLIAKNPAAKKYSELDLPLSDGALSKWKLKVEDLRYPDNLSRSVSHFLKSDSERERLRKLQAKGSISEGDIGVLWWQRYNVFSWWRDTLTRGIELTKGPTPVFNRFWHFWINHFALNRADCEGELIGSYHLSIRNNLNKKFEDLLFDAIWHPAMQHYLMNYVNVGPNSPGGIFNRQNGFEGYSINENLGRELLELYTVTPNANYTQDDVNGATYILTGWGSYFMLKDEPQSVSSRYFVAKKHEPGTHRVLGKTYGNERLEGRLEALCRDLARHPLTAKHIAFKLCRHFIADYPPQDAVQNVEDVFIKTKGNLVDVHRAVIDETVRVGQNHTKFMSPELWFWQIHRATRVDLPYTFYGDDNEASLTQIDSILMEIGELQGKAPQPNGWPDIEAEWLTPEYLDRRIRYASILAGRVSQDQKFDPKEYASRIFISDEELTKSIQRAESFEVATTLLFCNHKFLRS